MYWWCALLQREKIMQKYNEAKQNNMMPNRDDLEATKREGCCWGLLGN